jgi:hypothetical protein
MNRLLQCVARSRGLFVLVLWQAIPIGTDSEGHTRIGFGVGGGALEYANITCDGSVNESQKMPYHHAAVEIEHRSSDDIVIQAAGGFQWADSLTARGPFGAVLVGYQRKHFGIAVGLALRPTPYYDELLNREAASSNIVPNFSIRLGDRDGIHLRIESLVPSTQSYTELARLVVGINQFQVNRASGAIGLGIVGQPDNLTPAVVGEFFQPITRNIELGGRGYLGSGYKHTQSGLTAEIRLVSK